MGQGLASPCWWADALRSLSSLKFSILLSHYTGENALQSADGLPLHGGTEFWSGQQIAQSLL